MRLLKIILPCWLVLVGALICVTQPLFFEQDSPATVLAAVSNHNESYVATFTGGRSGANTQFQFKNLPPVFNPTRMFLTPDGEWLFLIGPSGISSPLLDPIYYGKRDGQFTTSPINAWWYSTSADSQYLFYASADPTGRYETYNLLRLATGVRVEFIVGPLPNPLPVYQLPAFAPYLMPLSGWTLNNNQLFVTQYGSYPPGYGQTILGFDSIDLSGINLNSSGTYQLPPLTSLATPGQYICSEGVLSPGGKKIAYAYIDSVQPACYFLTRNQTGIYDLMTDRIVTLPAQPNGAIFALTWNEDGSRLISQAYSDGFTTNYVFQYDITHNIGAPLSKSGPRNILLCSKWSFETVPDESNRRDTLYSFATGQPDPGTALFSAESIQLLSCTAGSNWNPAKVGVCDPFCTPMPTTFVGLNADVKKLNLSGGKPVIGEEIYDTIGCAGCHQAGVIAPTTTGTYTRIINERLKDPANAGETPEQYIAESILYPSAYVVPNFYDGIMPKDWGSKLSLSDLQDLIAYLMTQK